MLINVLHLNIERNNHTDKVIKLLRNKIPDVVCLQEALHKDVKYIAKELGYEFAFSPIVEIRTKNDIEQEGCAILSKYPLKDIRTFRYDDEILEKPPVLQEQDLYPKNGQRPENRFTYVYGLLTANIKKDEKELTISTTHFPVVDHTTPGHENHELSTLQNLIDVEHSENYLDKLIKIIRELKTPIVFTADLNNPRGEFFYDSLAKELVDQVPQTIDSTIDPNLHRVKGLKLTVDTIMTSPDVSVENFEIIENVSDHKALFASLSL